MFGISLAKILLVAAVIAAVWFGFKYLTADKDEKQDKLKAKDKTRRGAGSPPDPGETRAVEDMVRCAVCGAFQARNATPCERRDCPARA
ncbi:MAG: hypothetical protein ACT4N4_03515 [Rhodospirillales bacterium]